MNYLPFCISNNTAMDVVTLAQEQTSFNQAVSVQPLTSRMFTLPCLDAPQRVQIFARPLGALPDKAHFGVKLTTDLAKPGVLGEFAMSGPERTLRVSLEMQKSMKMIVIEEVKKKKFSLLKKPDAHTRLQYLSQSRKNLLARCVEVSDKVEEKTKAVEAFIEEQERSGSGLPPSARATFVQVLSAYDMDLCCGRVMRCRVFFGTGGEESKTAVVRGHLNYYNAWEVFNEPEELQLRLESRDLQKVVEGHALLRLGDYVEKEVLYDMVVPAYDNDQKLVGYVRVRFVNAVDPAIAQAVFEKLEWMREKELLEAALQRVHTEAYLEKTLNKKVTDASLQIARATHTGVYKQVASSSVRSSFNPRATPSTRSLFSTRSLSLEQLSSLDGDEGTEDLEKSMSYCVTLHRLMKVPLPAQELKGVYATASIGSTTLRVPVATTVVPDEEAYAKADELTLECPVASLGCEFVKEGRTFVVASVAKGGEADKAGVRVGHIVASVDGGDIPPTEEELAMLMGSEEVATLGFVAPPINAFNAILFEQQFIFPAGCTVNETAMKLSVWQEAAKGDDVLLCAADLPINRDNDQVRDVRLTRAFSACVGTAWESFDVESELVETALSLNLKGFAVSVVNAEPRELVYVSVNDLLVDVDLFESGKKTAELRVGSFQVDNQILGCRFPVLFGSPQCVTTPNQTGGQTGGQSTQRSWLHCAAIVLPHPSVLYVEYFSLLVQEMKISADSNILSQLLAFVNDLPLDEVMLTERAPLDVLNASPEFIKPLLIPDETLTSTSLFAEQLELQPLLITLTNKMDPAHPLTSSILPSIPLLIPLQAVIDSAGTLLGNVDHSQIKLNSFVTDSLFITQQDLIARLKMHYVKQFLGQLYKIIGSFSFLGNPFGLAENLTSGVKAFFYEPMQGLVKSPKEFVGGLGRGTKSLLMNTAYGVLNTVGKITGTVADGLSALSMSEEYKSDRAAGKGGLIYGVKEGVTGVVKDTVKGAKKGFFGALGGVTKGVVGLVVKPVVGVVDEATKHIDSVKNATQIEKRLERKRAPRYIYKDKCLTPFNAYLSGGQLLLADSKTHAEIPTDEEYMAHAVLDDGTCLVVGSTRFLWIDPASKNVNRMLKYKHVVRMQAVQRSVRFETDDRTAPMVVLNEAIAAVLPRLQAAVVALDWAAVTNLVVRLLQGAGQPVSPEDALLAALEMGDAKADARAEVDVKALEVVRAEVVRYHEGVESTNLMVFGAGSNVFTEYEVEVESATGVKWLVYRRYTHFK